jgi:hypothetical protein
VLWFSEDLSFPELDSDNADGSCEGGDEVPEYGEWDTSGLARRTRRVAMQNFLKIVRILGCGWVGNRKFRRTSWGCKVKIV